MGELNISLRNKAQIDEQGKMTIDELMVAGGAPENRVVQCAATRKS